VDPWAEATIAVNKRDRVWYQDILDILRGQLAGDSFSEPLQ
jgi:hypothetical protein